MTIPADTGWCAKHGIVALVPAMDERDAARVALIHELVVALSRHTWDVGPAREAKEILLDRIADAKAALARVPEELRP